MAQLAKTPCPGNWSFDGENWAERQEEQLQQLETESRKVDPNKSLVGVLIYLPWADGHAIYRVSKEKPLTLQHVPYMDAWRVPYAQIRGLRRKDILAQLRWQNWRTNQT